MKSVAVIGAGTMGHGIAQVAAMAGHDTRLFDAQDGAIDVALDRIKHNLTGAVSRGKVSQDAADACRERITGARTLAAAVEGVDLVIEAVVEDLDIKGALFADLNELTGPSTILATNTSSLSVAAIAARSGRPGRVAGMHFFNPVHIMKLVEIVRHDACDDVVVSALQAVAVAFGKDAIVVKDSPGFASSRLGVVLGLEAMRMVEQNVASAQDIDKALELGYGHPMGPLRVTDLVGLDVRLAIAEYLHAELGEPHYRPPEILRVKVADGHLGKKSGRGFYEWPNT